MRMIVLFCVPVLALGLACKKDEPKPKPATSATQSIASAVEEKPKRPAPIDLDAKRLAETLKCVGKKPPAHCSVMAAFDKAKAWDLTSIRGEDGRYFGKATIKKGDALTEHNYFLVVHKVPLNKVSDGDLAIKVALRELDPKLEAENNHVDKLMYLLRTDDAVSKRNRTAEYVRTYAPSTVDGATKTTGSSTLLHSGGGAHVREGKSRRLLVIKLDPAGAGSQPGDGLYAKLYPLSW